VTDSLSADAAARFLRRLASVPEQEMRVALWREVFANEHPDQVLDKVQLLMEHSRSGRTDWRAGLLALSRYLSEDRDRARRVLLPAAVIAGDAEIISLVVDEPPVKEAHSDELTAPLLNSEREITLGERRTWARKPDRDQIGRLVLDPDPIVIRHLLQNPRLIELDVLRIASRRPVSSEVLLEVFQSKKWSKRRQVQLSLIQNPYTPTQVGLSLVDLCDEDGLREVVQARSIHKVIVGRATERLRSQLQDATEPMVLDVDEWTEGLLERRGLSKEDEGDDDE